MRRFYQQCINYFRQVNWTLLLFLLLVLDVKLIIKVIALLFVIISNYKSISFKNFRQQRLIWFYVAMISIACINFLLQLKQVSLNYSITAALGISLWIMAAISVFFIYAIIQKDKKERLHRTIEVFFLLHIAIIGLNLLLIMLETGALNPYTYKGLNQKYYINTGDYIGGITFDTPVSTAIISAFALLYFLYRRRFLLSLAAMASMLSVGSNITNLLFIAALAFAFFFHTDKIQKSLITVYACMFIFFVAKVSPQNNEYVGRFVYKLIGKPYDVTRRNELLDYIKVQPDSLLTHEEQRKKEAIRFVDSLRAARKYISYTPSFTTENPTAARIVLLQLASKIKDTVKIDPLFYEYEPSVLVKDKIDKYRDFIKEEYGPGDTSRIKQPYDFNKPGKWIAGLQLIHFLKDHPARVLLGTGLANFSSRTAFKSTSLGIAGNYPAKYRYIHPWFRDNHLFLYAYYYSQQEQKHSAVNTPDSTYYQITGEYGAAGVLAFIFLYLGYFLKRMRFMSYGLPVLFLLLMVFFVEYWFEQLSIVILAELLLLMDIRSSPENEQPA